MADSGASRYLSRRPMVLGLAKVLVLAAGQFSFVSAAPFYSSNAIWAEKKGSKSASNPGIWLDVGLAIFLVLLGGVFAGLTIALMGQDEIYLQVIQDSGEGKEKQHAGSVLRLLHRGKHWVLVTLLLGNVITNETLPIVLDKFMGGGWPAVLGSTILVVIFGEIAPQSVCVRFGLPIGAWMSPFVLVLMYLMAPVAWPTAKLLDYLLGADHGTVYKKAGLKTLVSLHRSLGEAGQRLHADEVTIISAVLDLKEKTVGSIMTPMDNVFTLSLDDILDEDTMDDILSQGYSRIPVHHPDNDGDFVGMLLVKMLITYDPEDAKPVRDFALATLPETKPQTSCLDIVNFFQEGKSHMVMVSDHPGEDHGALGVVTLEDVIEELIGEEIIDESDVFINVNTQLRRMNPAPRTRFPKALSKGASKPKVEPGAVVNGTNGDLININEEEALKANEIQRLSPLDPPTQDHIPHRRSSAHSTLGNLGEAKTSKKAANADDLKEHLKHLGPSNLASRPKTTRYASVKIKPGTEANSNVLRTNTARSTLARRVSETTSEYGGGIGEGLLPSGGRLASDGVQALAVGYGAISTSPSNERRPTSANKAIQAESSTLDGSTETEANKSLRPPARTKDSDGSDDQVGDLPAERRSRSPYVHAKGTARSGSITENIIDINGVRKVVLETTSSSESNGDEGDSNGSGSKKSSGTSERRGGGNQQSSSQPGGNDGHGEEDGNSSSKKKRRRKKKAKTDSDETQPLLH